MSCFYHLHPHRVRLDQQPDPGPCRHPDFTSSSRALGAPSIQSLQPLHPSSPPRPMEQPGLAYSHLISIRTTLIAPCYVVTTMCRTRILCPHPHLPPTSTSSSCPDTSVVGSTLPLPSVPLLTLMLSLFVAALTDQPLSCGLESVPH
jgi:hypothetical protein